MNTNELITTLCWHCDHEYDILKPHCPKCGAANANVDLDEAMKQMKESE